MDVAHGEHTTKLLATESTQLADCQVKQKSSSKKKLEHILNHRAASIRNHAGQLRTEALDLTI
jgi:hypothetical protein